MASAPQLDITIVEAELVRIFDSLSFKQTQDLYVQLVCGYEDGSEKVVGRTEVCKNTGRQPKWDERFLCGRGQGKTLKFKVFVDHMWRSPTLCGEAEYDLDMLWARATPKKQKMPIPLYKKGDQTGTMIINMRLQDNSVSVASNIPDARRVPAAYEGYPAAEMQQQSPHAHLSPPPRAGQQHMIQAPGQNATYEGEGDPYSAEKERRAQMWSPPGQDVIYHTPHMQPPTPQRQEERRHPPQPQEAPQRRPEKRQTHPQQQPHTALAQVEDFSPHVGAARDGRVDRFQQERNPDPRNAVARQDDPRNAVARQGIAGYPNVGGQYQNRELAPPPGGYNERANAHAPRGGVDRGTPVAQTPQGATQAQPIAPGNAPRMQQHNQQRQQHPQQAQVPNRAEPEIRSPPTKPPTGPPTYAQTGAKGAPPPPPAPAIGKSGQWWNSFIDRG